MAKTTVRFLQVERASAENLNRPLHDLDDNDNDLYSEVEDLWTEIGSLSGDMTKAAYDPDDDGKVTVAAYADAAEKLSSGEPPTEWSVEDLGELEGRVEDLEAAALPSRLEKLRLGVDGSPIQTLDITETSPDSSQVHFGPASVGGFLYSPSADVAAFQQGCEYVDGACVARSSSAAMVLLSVGGVYIYENNNLTPGVAFTPTLRAYFPGGGFAGQLIITGAASKPGGGGWSDSSDKVLKENIVDLDPSEALKKVLSLKGHVAEWKDKSKGSEAFPCVIAQEVEKEFPGWVSEVEGYKAVGFPNEFNTLLIEALRGLSVRLDKLESASSVVKSINRRGRHG